MSDTDYLENALKQLVLALKQRNCLSQDFKFLTKAEMEARQYADLERHIDQFLKNP